MDKWHKNNKQKTKIKTNTEKTNEFAYLYIFEEFFNPCCETRPDILTRFNINNNKKNSDTDAGFYFTMPYRYNIIGTQRKKQEKYISKKLANIN